MLQYVKVRNVKKINIEKMKNNDVLIFALTIKANLENNFKN